MLAIVIECQFITNLSRHFPHNVVTTTDAGIKPLLSTFRLIFPAFRKGLKIINAFP